MKTNVFLLIIFIFVAIIPGNAGTSYYVNNSTGNDNNNGLLPATAFFSCNKAVNVTMPGDTVYFMKGKYWGGDGLGTGGKIKNSCDINRSGTAANPIIITAYPGDEGQVYISGNSLDIRFFDYYWHGLLNVSASNINISHLVINDSNSTGIRWGYNGTAGNNNLSIYHVNVSNTSLSSIYVDGEASGAGAFNFNNLTISNSNFSLCQNGQFGECFALDGTSGFLIQNNYVHDGRDGQANDPTNVHLGGEGIGVANAQNGTIRNNTVSNMKYVGIYLNGQAGNTSNIAVYNNIIKNIRFGTSMFIAGEADYGNTSNNQIYNNVVYNIDSSSYAFALGGTDNVKNNISYNDVYNNFFYGRVWIPVMQANNLKKQGNNFKNNVATSITDDFGMSADNMSNNWEINTSGDPGVVSLTNALFFPASSSSGLVDAGKLLIDNQTGINAPSFDMNGTTRPQGAGYDIGAYELQISAPSSISSYTTTSCNTVSTWGRVGFSFIVVLLLAIGGAFALGWLRLPSSFDPSQLMGFVLLVVITTVFGLLAVTIIAPVFTLVGC